MEQGVYMPVPDRVYVAVGHQLCSTTMVVGQDGAVIIDPGENDTGCAAAMADLRRFSDLPVRAVVYTHRHPDHCFAAGHSTPERVVHSALGPSMLPGPTSTFMPTIT